MANEAKPKFTPGEWRAWADRGEIWMVSQGDGRDIYFGCMSPDKDEADAHLVAAAPNLYARAESAVAMLRHTHDRLSTAPEYATLRASINNEVRELNAALSKARGEQ